ncbi:MAG: hypothetical protein HOP30_00015 [Cyclobacteriaceae bacterium]|nr:hypothetical protein [Cyclobacteriaceae bacterium]
MHIVAEVYNRIRPLSHGITFVFILSIYPLYAQPDKQILLVGTFHFNNPGLDAVKTNTFDINSPVAQKDIESMCNQFTSFKPDKIFVEWPLEEQAKLDTLYQIYLAEKYEKYISQLYSKPSQLNFYRNNEIFRVAFKVAKKAGLRQVLAFDFTRTSFPFDSAFSAMKKANQTRLLGLIDNDFKMMAETVNQKMETMRIPDILIDLNKPENLRMDKAWYIKRMNRAGALSQYAGAFLTAEWYRRNLYMYSIIQKQVTDSDHRIMVLAGSGHAAMLKEFVELDGLMNLVDVETILKR